MTNHPNRSKASPASNPSPAMIRAERERLGLTQAVAASVIYCSARGWQDWELGARAMLIEHRPPAGYVQGLRA